jgi:hypothetical protein
MTSAVSFRRAAKTALAVLARSTASSLAPSVEAVSDATAASNSVHVARVEAPAAVTPSARLASSPGAGQPVAPSTTEPPGSERLMLQSAAAAYLLVLIASILVPLGRRWVRYRRWRDAIANGDLAWLGSESIPQPSRPSDFAAGAMADGPGPDRPTAPSVSEVPRSPEPAVPSLGHGVRVAHPSAPIPGLATPPVGAGVATHRGRQIGGAHREPVADHPSPFPKKALKPGCVGVRLGQAPARSKPVGDDRRNPIIRTAAGPGPGLRGRPVDHGEAANSPRIARVGEGNGAAHRDPVMRRQRMPSPLVIGRPLGNDVARRRKAATG